MLFEVLSSTFSAVIFSTGCVGGWLRLKTLVGGECGRRVLMPRMLLSIRRFLGTMYMLFKSFSSIVSAVVFPAFHVGVHPKTLAVGSCESMDGGLSTRAGFSQFVTF